MSHQAPVTADQANQPYRTLVESCPDALVMADVDTRVIFASQRAAELFGAEDALDLCGRDAASLVAPEGRQRLRANILRLLDEGVRRNVEYTLLRKDGTRFTGEISAAVVHDDDGQPVRFTSVIRDVTERKQAQEAVQRECEKLRQLLRSSDRERQLIAYEVHDGPAQQVAGGLMYLQAYEHWKDKDPEKAKAAYDAALASLRQGHFEIRRLISGLKPPVLDEFGVEAAVAQLVHEKSTAGGPRLEFHSDVHFGRLPSVLENAIYRIAQEALTNACKHSQAKEIRVTLIQDGESVRLEIRDDGIGFDIDRAGQHRFGLKGIRERTRMLDGQLAVQSQAGRGTCVRVVLPLFGPAQERAVPCAPIAISVPLGGEVPVM